MRDCDPQEVDSTNHQDIDAYPWTLIEPLQNVLQLLKFRTKQQLVFNCFAVYLQMLGFTTGFIFWSGVKIPLCVYGEHIIASLRSCWGLSIGSVDMVRRIQVTQCIVEDVQCSVETVKPVHELGFSD